MNPDLSEANEVMLVRELPFNLRLKVLKLARSRVNAKGRGRAVVLRRARAVAVFDVLRESFAERIFREISTGESLREQVLRELEDARVSAPPSQRGFT